MAAGVYCIKIWVAKPQPAGIAPNIVLPDKPVAVPIDISSGCPVVQVLINGRGPYRFLLDTGSSGTHVSHTLAQALDLPPTGSEGTFRNAVGKEIEYTGVLIESIQLGEATFLRREVLRRSFQREQADGKLEEGILGYNLLGACLVTIDFPAGQLVIQEGRLPAADGRNVLAVVKEQSPTIAIAFGDKRVDTLVDSGSGSSFILPADIAGQLTPMRPPVKTWSKVAGEEQVHTFQVVRMKEPVRIGDHVIAEPIVYSHADVPAVVGVNVLRHFAVTFDAANRRVRFSRQGREPIRVRGSRTIGLTFGVRNGVATIDGIDPQGPAGGLGVRVGDRVLIAAGRPFEELDDRAFKDLFQTRDAIDLELERDGERFTINVPVTELP